MRAGLPAIQYTDSITPGTYWTILRDAQLFQFGIMNSAMHMAWIKCVSGKIECYERHSHNPSITTFPWPVGHTQAQLVDIEAKALGVLQARSAFPFASMEELYNPLTMPNALYQAHLALDKAVDAAYGLRRVDSDHSRIGFLFNLRRQISEWFVAEPTPQLPPVTKKPVYGIPIPSMGFDRPALA